MCVCQEDGGARFVDVSLERTFRRTQWQANAAGTVHGGVHRETQWEAANASVSRSRGGRCAIGIDDSRFSLDASGRCAVGMREARVSLDTSGGAVCRWDLQGVRRAGDVPLVFATTVSLDAVSGAVLLGVAGMMSQRRRCAVGICNKTISLERREDRRGEKRRREREEIRGERRQERREDRRGDMFGSSSHILSCPLFSRHVMCCRDVMSCHVTSCHVMSCHLMSCRLAWRRSM